MKRQILRQRETFHLEVPADENNLSEVRDFISDICMRAGFSKRETNNTKLAMDEACTNIIKHAYHEQGGEIRIDVQAEPGTVEINIFDRGTPFEWAAIKDPDLREYVEIGKKGGLGIYLMNRLMDRLTYNASEAGNHLFMAKSVAAGVRRRVIPGLKPPWTSTLRFKFGLRAGLGLLGLVIFLGIVQYNNQTREIDEQRKLAWVAMRNFARSLETKSRQALVIDNPYDPEYLKVSEFIDERMDKLSPVLYVRILNNDNRIVSSNNYDEFNESYAVPEELQQLSQSGEWRAIENQEYGTIQEFHYPIMLSSGEEGTEVQLGRVVLGVSKRTIEAGISDPRPETVLILAGIFIVGVSLIYLLISVLVKPIQALTDGVRAIGDGDFADEIKIEGPKEIGEIARAFNEITAKFRQAQKNVVEQERLQKEMQVAQEIQHSLLPRRRPSVSGYDIASLYRAAKEVGGDYYDFVKVNEDTMGVVVADVSGKGVPGSLVMTMIRTALRMEARDNLSAAEVMARMNDFVTEDMKKGMFVTIFYVILDSKNRIISYSSAGHNPMILYRAESDETFFLNPRGFPVGISLPDDTLFRRSIDVEKIKLKKDDMLIIYTDGVTEAMNEVRGQYGEERLVRLIKKHGRRTPQEFIDLMNEDIANFTGNYPQNDDITVVAIKEKLMADDVLFGIRKKLLDLVDVDGLTVAEACSRMNVSPSTYYRYRKRLLTLGERGLKNKQLREKHEIRRVSLEQRKEIKRVIIDNPAFGAKRIANVYNEGRTEQEHLTESLIYDELKRMRLNTYEMRLDYLRRNKLITEAEYQLMLESPRARREIRPEPTPEVEAVIEEEAAAMPEGAPALAAGDGLAEMPEFEAEAGSHVAIESEEIGEGIVLLRARGHLDSSSAGELEGILEGVYEYGYRKIIVDLSEISYISSGGWGIFTGRVKSLREGEGDVVLVGMSPEVYDIYELLGFQNIMVHFHNKDEAVDFLSLPFAERRERLESMVSARARKEREVAAASPAGELGEAEAESPWTPLRIEAGTVGEAGEITVLYLHGVIDTVSCIKLRSIMDDLLESRNVKLVVDMSRVEYVSSAGWGVFASRINEIRQQGGDIKIFGMDPEVDSIFRLLGFDDIMRSFSILTEAIDDFSKPAPAARSAYDVEGAFPRIEIPPAEEEEGTRVDLSELSIRFESTTTRVNGKQSRVLKIGGAIDASTAERFEREIDCMVHEEPRFLIVDLSDVVYVSSAGWGVIVKCMQRLNESAGMMMLAGMRQPIFKIFRDLGFEPLIPHYLTTERALDALALAGEGEPEQQAQEVVTTPHDAEAVTGEDEHVDEGGDEATALRIGRERDLRRDTDRKLRKLGWTAYGKRLMKRSKDDRKRKKER